MKEVETGILLWVKNYEACVDFYSNVLELKTRFQKPYLTTFDFGDSYLLVEKEDPVHGAIVRGARPPFILRLNVSDVQQAIWQLRAKGVEVEFNNHDWGDTGQFHDPDGNILQFCKWK
jgi:lactoylglutathione lyase